MKPCRRFAGAGLLVFGAVAAMSNLSLFGQVQTATEAKELFDKRCGGCHALDRDKEGPRLWGVYGRAAGSVKSFPYSDGLRKSGIRWSSEILDKWLTDTDQIVPNNDMTFRVEKPEERDAIIAYLKQNSD